VTAVDEREQVDGWRLKELVDAGYPVHLAELLAYNHDVDLHQAVNLVKRLHCSPQTAVRILA
jgi:hypothetical protein